MTTGKLAILIALRNVTRTAVISYWQLKFGSRTIYHWTISCTTYPASISVMEALFSSIPTYTYHEFLALIQCHFSLGSIFFINPTFNKEKFLACIHLLFNEWKEALFLSIQLILKKNSLHSSNFHFREHKFNHIVVLCPHLNVTYYCTGDIVRGATVREDIVLIPSDSVNSICTNMVQIKPYKLKLISCGNKAENLLKLFDFLWSSADCTLVGTVTARTSVAATTSPATEVVVVIVTSCCILPCPLVSSSSPDAFVSSAASSTLFDGASADAVSGNQIE